MEGNKTAALLIFGLFIGSCTERKALVTNEPAPDSTKPAQTQPLQAEEKSSGFAPVQSMLSRNCTPCHEPGGKMYDKLPFDNPEVVRKNNAPILRRINKPEDKQLMEDWLSEPIN